MSTLWTPGGERPIRRDPPESPSALAGPAVPGAPGRPGPGGAPAREPTGGGGGPQMAELRDQLARTPAEVVVANHAFGLFELAALHLSLSPPSSTRPASPSTPWPRWSRGSGARLGEPASSCRRVSASCAWPSCRSTEPRRRRQGCRRARPGGRARSAGGRAAARSGGHPTACTSAPCAPGDPVAGTGRRSAASQRPPRPGSTAKARRGAPTSIVREPSAIWVQWNG